jgi:hypothetical protein
VHPSTVGTDDEVDARAGGVDEAAAGLEFAELDLHDVTRHVFVVALIKLGCVSEDENAAGPGQAYMYSWAFY